MGESLTEPRTEATLPAPCGQHGTAGALGHATAEGHEGAVLLARARAEVDPVLRAALGSLPRPMRRVALYHFGWQQADGSPAESDSGKAIRPALVLAAADALGGPEARAGAVGAAAAVELIHNFTLLHDDNHALRHDHSAAVPREDNVTLPHDHNRTLPHDHNRTVPHGDVMGPDASRRYRPSARTVFGDADALLAGDALQALALRLLAQDPHPASPAAAVRLADCVIERCAGQHVDRALERCAPAEVTLDGVLAMVEAKTGALLGSACAIGGLYAGASDEEVAALDAFGREAGLAFRLIDDVIGLWGGQVGTGKPAGADLAARKKSLPVVAASGTPAAAELAGLYARPGDKEDLDHLALTVERAGGRDWAQEQAADRMARAIRQLARAVPDPEAAGGLLALAEFVTRRTG
ncbi:polyprenyl synthetase family protein [Streptomyces sp. NPDC007929]|uniref:polyprenyl synthetase family protein n=1 Tax=unclassified Streptomyces TaxID=2593676 RepID=UPI0036EABB01